MADFTNIASSAQRLSRVDKWQAVLQIGMRLRGLLWKASIYFIMRAPIIGKSTFCIGWPKVTHRNGKLEVGDRCFLGAGIIKVTEGATVRIGDRVLLNNGFVIAANEHVEIGADTLVGEYVSIRDADHNFADVHVPIARQGFTSAPIRIGADVWIGRGAVILKGTTIGKGAVVGANSVVTRDVAPYDIVVGSPARRIRSRRQGAANAA